MLNCGILMKSPQNILLDMVSRSSPPERHEFLEVACALSGSSVAAALLWLYDSNNPDNPNTQCDCYLLDRLRLSDETQDDTQMRQLTDDASLTGTFAFRTSKEHLHNVNDVAPTKHAGLRAWMKDHGLKHDVALSLSKPTPANKGEFVGFLQVLTRDAISVENIILLRYLAESLTQTITTRRETRLLQLSKSLFKAVDEIEHKDYITCDQWYRYAARQLVRFTQAKLCLIYSHDSRLEFKATHGALLSNDDLDVTAVPLKPDCRIRQIANDKRSVRLKRFFDSQEREDVFGTDRYDETHLNALRDILQERVSSMAAHPVVVDKQTIAVIAVFNKTVHLATTFSKVDELALETVAKSLATSLPAARINSALDTLCRLQVDEALAPSTDVPDRSPSFSIYEWLKQHVPGVSALGLYRKPFGSRSNGFKSLGGDSSIEHVITVGKKSKSAQSFNSNTGELLFLHTYPIESNANLYVSMRKKALSPHEERILKHLIAEMSHLIRSEQDSQMTLETLIQVRHVIRATLNGIGNIQPVLREYRRLAQLRDGDGLISSASFRKGLERTEQFYRRTSVLLEEAKFLLEEISAQSLQLDRHVISDIVTETCASMRCMAEYRGINIRFHDKLNPEHRKVDVDRNLIQIVLFNLVDNAIKYGYRDEDVIVDLDSEDNDWVATVTNRGSYIEEDDRARIFQKFVRKPSGPHAAQRPGTGLGLAVAKSVIEAHGGTISVHSVLKRKYPSVLAVTTFKISLPRRIVVTKGG
jgi:signal transduction histidine kinase